MKLVSFAVTIHKLHRKGLKGTLLVIYYKALVFAAKRFPGDLYSLLMKTGHEDCGIENNLEHLDAHVRKSSKFHFSIEDRDRIVDLIPVSLRSRTIESADKVMSYLFSFKGESHQFSKSIDWFLEPSGNKGWRWDMNRHLFLITLAKAYLYSKELKYLQRIEHTIADWVKHNPFNLNGPNWNEPFEVAARLSNWIWLYYLLKDSDKAVEDLTRTLLKGICFHGGYLFLFMEIHIPNNHLLLEARALFHAFMVLGHSPTVIKWFHKSSKYLFSEFKRQVRSDGGHSEQCITYHRIINSELWETYLLMSRNSKPDFLPEFMSALVTMTEFTRGMMRPDGSFPLTSDSSAVDSYFRFNPFMIAAVLLDRPEMKSAAMLLGEDDLTYFVLGFELATKYALMEPQSLPEESKAFSESGYYVMRDKSMGLHALIDCGPFSDELIPAHGHDDILSIDMTLGGGALLIDGGNDGLPSDAPEACMWREYFRGARSHNVLVLNHSNRSDLSGYRNVLRVAKPLACEWRTTDSVDYFSGAHDGYLRSYGVIQQRAVILVKGQFLCVIDSLIGDGEHQLEILYHLAPDKRAVVNEQEADILDEKGKYAHIAFFGIPGDVTIPRGELRPIQGWVSPESGCRMHADTVRLNACVKLPACAGTIIQISKNELFKIESEKCISTASHDLTFNFLVSGHDIVYEFSAGYQFTPYRLRSSKFRSPFSLRRRTGGGDYETLFSKN